MTTVFIVLSANGTIFYKQDIRNANIFNNEIVFENTFISHKYK